VEGEAGDCGFPIGERDEEEDQRERSDFVPDDGLVVFFAAQRVAGGGADRDADEQQHDDGGDLCRKAGQIADSPGQERTDRGAERPWCWGDEADSQPGGEPDRWGKAEAGRGKVRRWQVVHWASIADCGLQLHAGSWFR
jgi:hypothetical protein